MGYSLTSLALLPSLPYSDQDTGTTVNNDPSSREMEDVGAHDSEWIHSAVEYAKGGLETSHPSPFAAIIVNSNTNAELVRYRNQVVPDNDPTAHAEVGCIRFACAKLKTTSLSGFTLYSTMLPCPMCMSAVLWFGLDKVVFGTTVEDPSENEVPLFGRYSPHEFETNCLFDCQVVGPIEENLTRSLMNEPRVKSYMEYCRENGLRI